MATNSKTNLQKTPARSAGGPITIDVDYNRPRSIMEELLASQSATSKLLILHRGQEVEGEIVSINEKEITLDLGSKSEGVISAREIPNLSELKVGGKLKAFVYIQENEHGQTVLSLQRQAPRMDSDRGRSREGGGSRGGRSGRGRGPDWAKFTNALNQKTKLQGKVTEVNRGGLIVEALGVRGFLPNSQVGFELLSKSGAGMDNLIGQDLTVTVIEIDADNNKLIFSERGQVSSDTMILLKKFKNGQKVAGKIVAILPFGLVMSVKDEAGSPRGEAGTGTVEGLVFISDVAWEKVDDLQAKFSVGQELDVVVAGLDEELGRLNLSIKQLSEDPFAKLAEKYPVDEVVKGTVSAVSDKGVTVALESGIEGFLPASKVSGTTYEIGKEITALVDSVDAQRRKINLAPFVTSTAGLIYK